MVKESDAVLGAKSGGPLHGYRIIDLTTMISGPFATMILGDQGAEVIKVETPKQGDHVRAGGHRSGGLAANFLNNNRNKRSIALDLKSKEGRDVLLRLAAGADASRIAFGNTIKKQSDIAAAFALGIRVFTFDCAEELEKLAIAAPGASVICRIFVDNDGARWPLGAKFGCAAGAASDLLVKAQGSGLAPLGVAFHVGSQQTDLASWDMAIGQAAMIFTELRERGIELATLNIGGGVPVAYAQEVPEEAAAITAIQQSLARHFGNRMPAIMAEPGRCLAATAGMVRSEVVLATQRDGQDVRWVYLDIGKFGGLAETIYEAIQYPIVTERDGGNPVPTVLAGPTCDGADVLYQIAGYQLPAELGAGDWVEFRHAGAYTASYSSVGFNGFGPLKEYYL